MATTAESVRGDEKKREQTTRFVFDTIILTQLSTEPTTPIQGMIAYADGSGWNPSAGGEGIYFYNSAGTWVKLG